MPVEKHLVHSVPAMILEKSLQIPFHAPQVEVMAEPRLETDVLHARLPGIEFPGMEIKHATLVLGLVQSAYRPAEVTIRCKAKIATAATPSDGGRGRGRRAPPFPG